MVQVAVHRVRGRGRAHGAGQAGRFKVIVTTTGELRARKFVQIQGPNSQPAQVYQIEDHVDRSRRNGRQRRRQDRRARSRTGGDATCRRVTLDNQKAQAEFTNASLDSALNLAHAREDVRTAEYALEEKKLAKEQATYEAPTIKRQAEIDYEKAQRALEQSKRNLDTKTKQAVAKMAVAGADLGRQQNNLKMVQDGIGGLHDHGAVAGNGDLRSRMERQEEGRRLAVEQPWDPTVATLPDLAQMESQTYVNEVDVRKLRVGQKVAIALDADPTKKLAGTVTGVANVGEQRPEPGLKGLRGEDRGHEGRHDAPAGHDDVERDRSRVGAERAVDSARGGDERGRLSPTSTRRAVAAS